MVFNFSVTILNKTIPIRVFTDDVNLLINEFMFNPSASGDPNEFIEVKGDADTDYSEWSLIVVDGDGSVAGKIDNVFNSGRPTALATG